MRERFFMANVFGTVFKIMSFGESHGKAVGVVIEGIPGNMALDLDVVQNWLDRRRPGQSSITSPRVESDTVDCLSGLENGRTLGGPLTLLVHNKNTKPEDYSDVSKVFRPGHADYTTQMKYGITATSGGGRASARETIGRVAAGAVAWQLIKKLHPDFEVLAWVQSVRDTHLEQSAERRTSDETVTRDMIEATSVRCPDPLTASKMEGVIQEAKSTGDSVGGVIRCVMRGVPSGLGEPVFDKLEADLAKAIMSLPACKGFEIGSGFAGSRMMGSTHNDPLIKKDTNIRSLSNHSGGIQGGISNGEIICFNAAFKPVSTIMIPQETVDRSGREITFKPAGGRHDPCVLPRAVPMVEAMATLVIADHVLRQRATAPLIES
jgi:chorismate synthase